MIVRTHRFHGYNALRNVYSHGQTVRGSLVAIKYLANPRRDSYRAAVVVSRKVHKSAVVRNRIRRRLFEIIRSQQDAMTGPFDIVVTVFSEQVATITAAELHNQIVWQFERAGITVAPEPSTEEHAIVDTKKGV